MRPGERRVSQPGYWTLGWPTHHKGGVFPPWQVVVGYIVAQLPGHQLALIVSAAWESSTYVGRYRQNQYTTTCDDLMSWTLHIRICNIQMCRYPHRQVYTSTSTHLLSSVKFLAISVDEYHPLNGAPVYSSPPTDTCRGGGGGGKYGVWDEMVGAWGGVPRDS